MSPAIHLKLEVSPTQLLTLILFPQSVERIDRRMDREDSHHGRAFGMQVVENEKVQNLAKTAK